MAKQTKTERLRSNVMRTIRAAEKRGYTFTDELKQKVKSGSYQTLASLQRGRYGKLYEQSKVEIGGEQFSGRFYRNVIRPKIAAQKAAITREVKKKVRQYKDIPDEGQIVYRNIKQMTMEHPTPGARVLEKQLNSQIEKYGFDTVMRAMAQSPAEMISAAQTAIEYKSDKSSTARAFNRFFNLLKGAIITVKESKEAGNVADTAGYNENENF